MHEWFYNIYINYYSTNDNPNNNQICLYHVGSSIFALLLINNKLELINNNDIEKFKLNFWNIFENDI